MGGGATDLPGPETCRPGATYLAPSAMSVGCDLPGREEKSTGCGHLPRDGTGATDLPDGERSDERKLPCDEKDPMDATDLPGRGRGQSRRGATDLPGPEKP